MFCLNLLEIAVRLAVQDPTYADLATKFFEHFAYIASAMYERGLWNEADSFYYDVFQVPGAERGAVAGALDGGPAADLRHGGGPRRRHRAHARVRLPDALVHREQAAVRRAGLTAQRDARHRGLPAVDRGSEPPRADARPHARHRRSSCRPTASGRCRSTTSTTRSRSSSTASTPPSTTSRPSPQSGLFGGNSNWRGPVWFPVNYLLIQALTRFGRYLGDDFLVEHPTGSGTKRTLAEVADDLGDRLIDLFRADADGNRPAFGGDPRFARRRLARPAPVLRVLPRRHRRRPRRVPPDRLDRSRRRPHPAQVPAPTSAHDGDITFDSLSVVAVAAFAGAARRRPDPGGAGAGRGDRDPARRRHRPRRPRLGRGRRAGAGAGPPRAGLRAVPRRLRARPAPGAGPAPAGRRARLRCACSAPPSWSASGSTGSAWSTARCLAAILLSATSLALVTPVLRDGRPARAPASASSTMAVRVGVRVRRGGAAVAAVHARRRRARRCAWRWPAPSSASSSWWVWSRPASARPAACAGCSSASTAARRRSGCGARS